MNEEIKKSRLRSPNYPAIELRRAVDLAKNVYDAEHRSFTAPEILVQHMGFRSLSGASRAVLSALKQFDLLEEKSGQFRVSELALDTFLQPDEEKRKDALKLAALAPTIHRELWEHYEGKLPSDANLKYQLERERAFNPKMTSQFIKQYRGTLELAGLTADSVEKTKEPQDEGSAQKESSESGNMKASPAKGNSISLLNFPLHLIGGKQAQLSVPPDLVLSDLDLLKLQFDNAVVVLTQILKSQGKPDIPV